MAETGSSSTALPDKTYTYDNATGLQTAVTAGGVSVTTGYDALGRAYSTTDADGNTATTTYDAAGRVASTNDGKGTYSYTYNGTDAAGKAEYRGLPTGIAVSTVGSFTAAYDAAGNLIKQVYPNGLTATSVYDDAGKQIGLTYAKGTPWLAFTAVPDADGRTVETAGPNGSLQHYTYDTAGRLTKVADTYNLSCETRTYGFDVDTNRTSQTSFPAADDGTCSTSTTPATITHSYDSADRITDAGYAYDAFGRTTAIPAGSTANATAVTAGYYAGYMVRTLTQGSTTKTYALDPLGRIRQTTSAAGTQTNHYTDAGDSPAWIVETNGTWTRNVVAFGGLEATQTSTGTLSLQLTNLHGDVVATCADSASATGIDAYTDDQTEYGLDRTVNTTDRYEWLGGAQRASDTLADIVLMGVRLYNPTTGRFLQVDPVVGGNANAYEYCGADPINCTDIDGRFSLRSSVAGGAQAVVDITAGLAADGACFGVGNPLGYAVCNGIIMMAGSILSDWVGAAIRGQSVDWSGTLTHAIGIGLMTGGVGYAFKTMLKTSVGRAMLKWVFQKVIAAVKWIGTKLLGSIGWILGSRIRKFTTIMVGGLTAAANSYFNPPQRNK